MRTERKKIALVVRRIGKPLDTCFLVFWGLIIYIYEKCDKSKRFKEYSQHFIPALIVWGAIGALFFVLFLCTLASSSNESHSHYGAKTSSHYEVDQSALDEASRQYRARQNDEFYHVDDYSSSEADESYIETQIDSTKEEESENEEYEEVHSILSEAEICLLTQAVQHETGSNPDFYPYGDYDVVQQYMAASIINRIGEEGFGVNYSTPYSIYEVLSNSIQYGNMLNELNSFSAYDERTRKNVYAVLNGSASIPSYLYFERCSNVGEDYTSAQNYFYTQYGYDSSIQVAYMSQTLEGRYIIFATNPYGAYSY